MDPGVSDCFVNLAVPAACTAAAAAAAAAAAPESVIVSPDGMATMLDKYGGVFEAAQNPDGSFSLVNPRPSAHLGPGRPLGAAFNAQGDLFVCDALKVGGYVCLVNSASASSQCINHPKL